MNRAMMTTLALTLTTAALAKPPRPDLELKLEDRMIPLQDACFPSGLRVLLQEDHAHPVVTVTTIYEGGLQDDAEGAEGTSHLMEHLWFRSVHDGLTVGTHLETMGARYNAYTNDETVTFRTVAPADRLEGLLALAAARFTDPLLGVEDRVIDIEREVVRNESRLGFRPLQETVRTALNRALFPAGHPRARDAFQNVDGIQRAQLDAFADTSWTPRNATLVVVGDRPLEELWSAVTHLPVELLGDPENPTATSGTCNPRLGEQQAPPDPSEKRPATLQAPVEKPVMVAAWTLPGAWRDDFVEHRVAAGILSTLATHRAQSPVYCTVVPHREASILQCSAEADTPAQLGRIKRNVIATAQSLVQADVQQYLSEALEDVYAAERRTLFENMDDFGAIGHGRGMVLANHLHATASGTPVRDALIGLEKMTTASIVDLFKSTLNPGRMVVLEIEPQDDDGSAALDGSEQALLAADPDSVPDPGVVDEARLAALMATPDLSGMLTSRLDNGLQIVVLPVDAGPRARATLILPSGARTAAIPGTDDLLWWSTDHFYSQGTYRLREVPRSFFGSWDLDRTSDAHRLSVTASAPNLAGALFALRDMADHVEINPLERKQALTRSKESADYYSGWAAHEDAVWGLLTPDAGGMHGMGPDDALALKGLKPKVLAERLKGVVQPDGATLLIVGRIDAAEAMALGGSWFEDWKTRTERPSTTPPKVARPEPAFVGQALEGTHAVTDVQLTCPVANDLSAQVLAAHLREASWATLRDQRGLSYGVEGSVISLGEDGVLVVSASVQRDGSAEAVQAFTSALDSAAAGLEDIRRDKLVVARATAQGWLGRDRISDRLGTLLGRGDDPAEVATWAAQLHAVDAAAVKATAATCKAHAVVSALGEQGSVDAAKAAWGK